MKIETDSHIYFPFFHLHKFISKNIRKLNGLEIMLHVILGIVRLVVHIFARRNSANIYLFRVISRKRERWKICSKLTLKSGCILEHPYWMRGQISHLDKCKCLLLQIASLLSCFDICQIFCTKFLENHSKKANEKLIASVWSKKLWK